MYKLFGRNLYPVFLLLLLFCFHSSISYPAEQPTKFTLSTGGEIKNANSNVTPTLQKGQETLGRFMDALRIGRGRLVNTVTLARNILANRAEQVMASESQNNAVSVINGKTDLINQGRNFIESAQSIPKNSQTPYTRETVRLEHENAQGILEKRPQKPVERILENFLRPTPIVDGIKEEEKYGNSGDKFIGIGRALVGGFEGFSNFLNAVVDFPVNAAKKTSRGITEVLNQIGARLIGLQ